MRRDKHLSSSPSSSFALILGHFERILRITAVYRGNSDFGLFACRNAIGANWVYWPRGSDFG
jgi:hypothetical protein